LRLPLLPEKDEHASTASVHRAILLNLMVASLDAAGIKN